MIKFLKILFISLFFVVKADALEWSEWTDIKPNIPNVEIETEDRYQWYIDYNKDLGYVAEENSTCSFLDKKDKKVIKTYLPNIPDGSINKKYVPYNKEVVRNLNYFSAVGFTNLSSSIPIDITEFEVFDKKLNKNITYDFGASTLYSSGSKTKLKDKNKSEKAMTNKYTNRIQANLNYYYNVADIYLRIYYIDNGANVPYLYIETFHGDLEVVSYAKVDNLEKFITCTDGLCMIDVPIANYLTPAYFNSNNILYESIDTYFKCYNKEKFYLDGYYKNINGFKKDTKTKKTFYRYKKYNDNDIESNLKDNKNTIVSSNKKDNIDNKDTDLSVENNNSECDFKPNLKKENNNAINKFPIIDNSSESNTIEYETRNPEIITYHTIEDEQKKISEMLEDNNIVALNTKPNNEIKENNNLYIYLFLIFMTIFIIAFCAFIYYKKKMSNRDEII